jgi:hypothetical protein
MNRQPDNNQLELALESIKRAVLDGIRHGHFEYTLTCEIVNGNRRCLIIKAGKHRKYLIEPTEAPA